MDSQKYRRAKPGTGVITIFKLSSLKAAAVAATTADVPNDPKHTQTHAYRQKGSRTGRQTP